MLKVISILILGSLIASSLSGIVGWTVAGTALPPTLTIPTPDQGASFPNLNRSVTTNNIVISNTDSSVHTVTIQDCQATPFKLLNATTIPAVGTAGNPLIMSGPIRFTGCIKWSASSTTVMGTMVGQ
jgi:hypothetical protein